MSTKRGEYLVETNLDKRKDELTAGDPTAQDKTKLEEQLLMTETEAAKEKETTVDDIVDKIGLFHVPLVAAYFCRDFFFAIAILFPSFAASTMDHWCAKPKEFAAWSSQEWKKAAIPLESTADKLVHSRCYMRDFAGNNETGFYFLNATVPCKEWEYDTSFYSLTLVNQWNLVCERSWLVSFSQSLFLGGMMIGSITFSHLSDRYGRKRSLFFSTFLSLTMCFLIALSPYFWVFNIMRVILSIGCAGLQGAFISLMFECVTQKKRYMAVVGGSGYAIGGIAMAWLSYFVTNWKTLQLLLCTSPVICGLLWFFLPESPRWLLATGKLKEAESCLSRIVKQNNVKNVSVQDVIQSYRKRQKMEDSQNSKMSYLDLFRTRRLRLFTLLICAMFIVHRFLTFHLTFFSARMLENPYLGFTIVSAFMVVSDVSAIFFVKYFRRKIAMVATFAVTGLSILLLIPFTEEHEIPRIAVTAIARVSNSAASYMLNAFAAELYPTVVRSMGLGLAFTVSRFGAVLSPYFKELEEAAGVVVSSCLAAGITIFGASAAVFLPETIATPLPEDIDDIERIFYKKKTSRTE